MGVRAEAIAPNDLACARRGRFAWWASKGAQKPNLRSKASTTMRAVSAQRGELDAEGASKRGHAANIYADKKNTRYNRIITERSLDINYRSFIVESFGAFASDTWKFILNTVCDPNTHPNANDENNPWNNPDPSRAFILATAGFANQRGNAVMLLHANSRRRFQRASRRHASG